MAEVDLSSSSLDYLEAVIAELDAAQLCFTVTQASMISKLNVILLKLSTMVPISLLG